MESRPRGGNSGEVVHTAKLPKSIFVDFEITLDLTSFWRRRSQGKIRYLIRGSEMAQNSSCRSAEVEVDERSSAVEHCYKQSCSIAEVVVLDPDMFSGESTSTIFPCGQCHDIFQKVTA